METINTVEKEIEVKLEQGREQLVALKNLAYDKYCEAWNSMEHIKDSTFETLSSAWEQAWSSYSGVVQQLKMYGHTAIEKSMSEYDLAKANLSERTRELQTWIVEHGQMLRDDPTDAQVEVALKLHEARKDAYEKYIHAKDALINMFTTTQQESKEDVKNAQEKVRKTSLNLERHLQNSTDTASEEFLKSKLRLEESKSKAVKELEEAEAYTHSLSAKFSTWSQEVVKILSEQSEFLSQRVLQMRDQLFSVASESKDSVENAAVASAKVMSHRWEHIFNSLKDEAVFAFDKLKQVKDSFQETLDKALDPAPQPSTPSEKQPLLVPTASPINVALA